MVLKVYFFMQHEYGMLLLDVVPHQKKVVEYSRHMCSGWHESHSSSWLILLSTTYINVVSVPVEDDRYITIITTYPSSGARAFNVARIELHT
jgi:hypothetical protein